MIRLIDLIDESYKASLLEDDDGLGSLPSTGPTCAWCGIPVSSKGRMGKSNLNLCPKCKVKYYLGDNKKPDVPVTDDTETPVNAANRGPLWNEAKERNYKKEYEEYQGKPDQIKRRAGRNAARRKLKKLGRVRKGQDVDHKNRNPRDNKASNLQALSPHKNRGKNS